MHIDTTLVRECKYAIKTNRRRENRYIDQISKTLESPFKMPYH